jgi:nicotinamide-nucleotide amidase
VPYEMQGIFTDYVLPKLKSTFSLPAIYHRTLQTIGIGESFLAEKIKDIESELPDYVKLAYLPAVGMVRLRLSGYGNNYDNLKIIIDEIILRLYDRIGEYIFGEEQDTIEQVIGLLLKSIDATLSTAESCTGGYIAHRLTSVAGSSGYFTGSIIAYDNKIKINELGVSPDTISSFGAVSKQCVIEMANGIRSKFGTTYSIATSGIAGPDGGTPDKPVGTVWIAVAGASNCVVKCFNMGNNRERTIQRTTLTALDLLRKMILENA